MRPSAPWVRVWVRRADVALEGYRSPDLGRGSSPRPSRSIPCSGNRSESSAAHCSCRLADCRRLKEATAISGEAIHHYTAVSTGTSSGDTVDLAHLLHIGSFAVELARDLAVAKWAFRNPALPLRTAVFGLPRHRLIAPCVERRFGIRKHEALRSTTFELSAEVVGRSQYPLAALTRLVVFLAIDAARWTLASDVLASIPTRRLEVDRADVRAHLKFG